MKVWLLDNGSIVIEHTQFMWNVPGPQVRIPSYGVLVEHDDGLARVGELVHHVAADITGASRHENCHLVAPCACGNVPAHSKNCALIAPPDGMVMAAILNDRYMSATNAPCPTSFSSRHLRSAM